MKISIGLYMDEDRAKKQLSALLEEIGLTMEDFGGDRFVHPNFHLENDYVRITRQSLSEGSRGYRNHFAICSISDYDTKADLIEHIVRRSLEPQNALINAFRVLNLDHKYDLNLNMLRGETNKGVHLDIGSKDFIIASVKVVKAIHEALKGE